MKKRAFLVPTALTVAALTQGAAQASVTSEQTKIDQSENAPNAEQSAGRTSIEVRGAAISTYSLRDELFGFVIERKVSGEVTAAHYSHVSHSSHASHSSHYSGQ